MARTISLFAGCVALAAMLPAAAAAESTTASFEVSVVVEPACRVSATPMTFKGRGGESMDAASQITVACNDDTPVAVRLDAGMNAEGGERRLAGEGEPVEYAIYADASRSLQWEAGATRTGTAGAVPLALGAYGRIDADATLGALGAYRDTITVTVEF
jgi:spore coat protein U-like protein